MMVMQLALYSGFLYPTPGCIDFFLCRKWIQPTMENSPAARSRSRGQCMELGHVFFQADRDCIEDGPTGNAVCKSLSHRNAVSWTKLISEKTKHGQPREALRIYTEMREHRIAATAYTFAAALRACSSSRDLDTGKKVHAHAVESLGELGFFVETTLVDMYAKCGSMMHAQHVFDTMARRNVVSWNSLIHGYVQRQKGELIFELFARMQEEGVAPDDRTFVCVLKACSSLAVEEDGTEINGTVVKIRCLEKGRIIHSQITKSGLVSRNFVANSLIDMYANCGSMVEARRVFDGMSNRDTVSWNVLIRGYHRAGESDMALQMYSSMTRAGFSANNRTFVAAINACASLTVNGIGVVEKGSPIKTFCLERGRTIHSDVTKSGLESDIFVANSLVDMYAKCGSMVDSRIVFDRMSSRDVVSWNALILGYAQADDGELALELYARMYKEGFTANNRTFVAALKACASLAAYEVGQVISGSLVKIRSLEKGRSIHCQVAKRGLETQIYVANSLLDMYSKCGSMVDAHAVFNKMSCRNVVSWNTLIHGYASSEDCESALELFERMQHEGPAPDTRTFVSVLKGCSSLGSRDKGKEVNGESLKAMALEKGRAIHSQLTVSELESNVLLGNSLLDMYAKCGSMADAQRVFRRMSLRDVGSWNTMIQVFNQTGEPGLALECYSHMQREGYPPDHQTFVAVLMACASLACQEEPEHATVSRLKMCLLEKGRAIHSQVTSSGLESNVFVASTLVDMYAKCGSILEARQVFDKMSHRDVVSWNVMIYGYAHAEQGEWALQLYEHMLHEGVTPDCRTFVAILMACASLAALEEFKVVNGIPLKIGSLEKGRAIHSQVTTIGVESDIFVGTTLMHMYAKCGSIVEARRVFEKMPCHCRMSWNVIMHAYVQREDAESALELFAGMQEQGLTPNGRTFVTALMACTSLAAQEKGKEINGKFVKVASLERGRVIHSQVTEAALESDRFVGSVLVDMYVKCGSMDDAYHVFDRMPCRDVVSWNAIIQGYAETGEGEFALQLYACMQREGLAPDHNTFISALKACSRLGALERGKDIHFQIQSFGLEGNVSVANSLLDMYGKCGSMVDAQHLFDAMLTRDLVTWNTFIRGYSCQADGQHAMKLFHRMQQEGIQPDSITFLSVITACSHAGLVDHGLQYFQTMNSKYGITPTISHYNSMVDLLGRAGRLNEAMSMAKGMPYEADKVTWITVMGACQKWNDVTLARHAFASAVRLDEHDSTAYVLMSNIYEAAGLFDKSNQIQEQRRKAGAHKRPGQSWWIDYTGKVHSFVAGDGRHPQSKDIYRKLKDMSSQMTKDGYVVCEHGNERENALSEHSEMLAIACALINAPPTQPIRIMKNLRVCEDCHQATAIISKLEKRIFVCRDAIRFHVYKDGNCSCGGFW